MADPTQGLKLFNTLTGKLEAFVPLDPAGKQVKLYVCGPTVYDDAHLGHARCYITWDVLYRFLKFLGYDVKYVRNVTDVDDKILNRAKERGESPAALAERNYESFTADMKALNVLSPDEEPRATQFIPQMLAGIQALIQNGSAYVTRDGSVYFRVSAKADYGKLKFGTQDPAALQKHLEDLKSGARVEVDEEKESPLDFALWKAVPLDDPHGWASPWPAEGASQGWGRPGWHMECSAMNHAVFGEQIDIHAGGADLIFPHHENEIAQSEAWSGLKGDDEHSRFAKYWLHNGFVNVSGEKMSKSLGNFSTIKKLLDRYDANTIRYFLLTHKYDMPVDFNEEALEGAENWIRKRTRDLIKAKEKLGFNFSEIQSLVIEKWSDTNGLNPASQEVGEFSIFRNELLDQLNTPQALATLNNTLSEINSSSRFLGTGQMETVTKSRSLENSFKIVLSMFDLLGFDLNLLFGVFNNMPSQGNIDLVRSLVERRRTAKSEKNWAEADRIRNEIIDQGYQLLDNKDGTTTVEKDGLEILRV